MIEEGQYCTPKLPREERLCSICSECRLEDEKHFLLDCQFYIEERNLLKLWLSVARNIDFNKSDLAKKLKKKYLKKKKKTKAKKILEEI